MALFLVGCGGTSSESTVPTSSGETAEPVPPAPRVEERATAPAVNPPTAFIKNVDPAEAAALLGEPGKVVVLDVRTPAEFQAGHIAGATNVDFRASSFAENLRGLDKNKPYLMHCQAGGRSTRALETMRELGFTQVYHLDGGVQAWKEEGKPLVK